MLLNIDKSIVPVNRYFNLSAHKRAYIFQDMNYGERLKQARDYAKLSQIELANRVGIKQPSLSYLENPNSNATGSEHTVRFARICGVSVDWLADEVGDMLPDEYHTTDPKIIAALKIMEPLSEYGKEVAVKSINEIAQLIAHIKDGGNGTTG